MSLLVKAFCFLCSTVSGFIVLVRYLMHMDSFIFGQLLFSASN